MKSLSKMATHGSAAKSAIVRLASLVPVLMSVPAISWADIIRIGASGEAGCHATTLNQAISMASNTQGPDVILLSNTIGYTNEAVQINNQDLVIVGGYEDCQALESTAHTHVFGTGGIERSVFEIRGTSVVELHNLLIRGGDEVDTGNGGGIEYKGHGELKLENVRVSNNWAGHGGGLYFESNGGDGEAVLTLGDNVYFLDNHAAGHGGAIYLTGNSLLKMDGEGNYINGNTAVGNGGGLYMVAPAHADIGASSSGPTRTLFERNDAARGAAIAIEGANTSQGAARLRLYTAHGNQEILRLLWNEALESGGAIYAEGKSFPQGDSHPEICIWDAVFEGNEAPVGAAIHLVTGNSAFGQGAPKLKINPTPAEAEFCDRPTVMTPCVGGCTAFDKNIVRHIDGAFTNGAVVDLGDSPFNHQVNGFAARANVAGSLIGAGTLVEGDVSMNNCLVYGNTFSRNVVDLQQPGVRAHVRHCTVANNNVAGALFSLSGVADRPSSLTNSIASAAPGRQVLARSGPPAGIKAEYLIASEIGSLPPADHVITADPRFIDAGNGNYRLREDSDAVDFAPANDDGLTHDLNGKSRTADGPVTNLYGPRDLGAYERQLDAIFNHGFE